ncbi:MAG: rod shape-determining protein MreC [Candidatus Omnitrophica bacterium]|nr:rod shape-determining protein MreC [Candidatus Omnitrophota bacterium]
MFKLKKKLISSAVFVVLFLFILSWIPSVRPAALSVLKLPLYIFNGAKRELAGVILYHRNYVLNDRLINENNLLKNKFNTLNEIYLENARLKKLLSFKQQAPFKVIPARVIGRAMDSFASVVIIDKGNFNGVRRGMSVITHFGLLGRVIESSQDSSKVMILSDPSLGVSGVVQRTRQEGLVSGTLGAYLIMKYLPQDADIRIQDRVITSGFNQAYPKGILIGTVVEIGNEFSSLGRYAVIKPAANLSYAEEVLVVLP